MKIAICDDDKVCLGKIKEITENIIADKIEQYFISEFTDGQAMLDFCINSDIDILLVDIDMPVLNGFEAVEMLQGLNSELKVVFVTNHEEFAYRAYDYTPCYFVSKTDWVRLENVLEKLIDNYNITKRADEAVYIISEKNTICIDVKEAVYIDSYKNYVIVHNQNGEEFSFRATIKDVYIKLRNKNFVQVQRGILANCRFIELLNRRYVQLRGGSKISMTRDKVKYKEAERIYTRYMRLGI